MTALTSLGLFVFAVIVFVIRELQLQGKLKWMKEDESFWGKHSDKRKYDKTYHEGVLTDAPDNFYYRLFKIKYVEAFPGSATIFVSLTDAPHALQLLFKILIIGSLVSYKEMVNLWVDFIIYFSCFGVAFTLTYRHLSK